MRGLINAVSPASPRFPSGASEPDRPAKKVLASRLALLPLMALLL
ncbi:MAG TPA: peptidase M23, partial [Marinobacter adhaerens]|nr:peptidase M23 [Marinobacter adhaerens]